MQCEKEMVTMASSVCIAVIFALLYMRNDVKLEENQIVLYTMLVRANAAVSSPGRTGMSVVYCASPDACRRQHTR